MTSFPRDDNRVPVIGGKNNATNLAQAAAIDNATGALIVTNVGGSGGGLDLPVYDYMTLTISPATTETYVFKTGGSGGTTVATVVIVYTDASRADISTVTKT